MAMKHVEGKNKGNIVVYALSTCPWCQKTKKLLSELGVDYYFEDVDLASPEDRKRISAALNKWNPQNSFPTIVIDNARCIIGFKEQDIREAVK
ncbi:MAG: glutaredoxin family protein [Dehalococcoidales bacterium]|nr:glutaredoxin family protein [Dehalococcoidales bacterium]